MFINPLLAFGALLAAVPLIIHLLNRRRHRPLQWAAMRFVLAAYKRTRRRAQLENLLLLLLRMAAVVLLALALARPFTRGQNPLTAFTETRRSVVLVLDGSASTGYRENVKSVHERIVERARELLSELDSSRGDRVRLIWAADHPRLLSWGGPEQALQLLSSLEGPRDETLDLAAALGAVAEYAEEDAAGSGQSELEVRVLTDLQLRSFQGRVSAREPGSEAETAPQLHDQLDRLEAVGLRVAVEDLGPGLPIPPNLTVAALTPLTPVLGPDTPLDLGVTVLNRGPDARPAVRVSLAVDGERRPTQVVDVPARGQAEAVFGVIFAGPGTHLLEASIEGDRLAVDDRRTTVLEVPPPIRVLLVNGAPAAEIERDEVGFLRAVLEPLDDSLRGLGSYAPFQAREVGPDVLGSAELDLAEFDVIWLANVRTLSRRAVEELEARVAAGAGLVISLGDEVDDTHYNRLLWRADGTGLLPAELTRAISLDPRSGYYRVKQFDVEHPALRFFDDERWRALWTEVPIQAFIAGRPLPDARVLATLDDENDSPLLVERDFDRGRVALWTTTIDMAWTRLPQSPRTLVPLVHEILRHVGRPPTPPRNLAVGGALVAETRVFPRGVVLAGPDGSRRPLEGEPPELAEGLWALPTVPVLDRIGLWRLEREGAEALLYGVQLDPEEGDLQRAAPDQVETHPVLHLVAPSEVADSAERDESPARGELWRLLAGACLAALMVESLWAAWLGRRRRLA